MSLATVGSVVGIASGVNSLMNSGGGGAPGYSGAQQQATGPWWQRGGPIQASDMLQQLIGNPSSIMKDPLFKSFNDQSMQAMDRMMRAQGKGASGEEMASLNNLSQSNAMSYYQQQAGLLGSLAGVGFNPASGVQAGLGAAQQGAAQSQGGWGAIAGGLQGLTGLFSGSSGGSGSGYNQYGSTSLPFNAEGSAFYGPMP